MLTSPRPELNVDALPNLDSLDANVPLLLVPVRVQTKFVHNTAQELIAYQEAHPEVLRYDYELLVRIYPDQLSIDRHEEGLTASEIASGQLYWEQALTSPDRADKGRHSLLAWQQLLDRYGANRAFWIVQHVVPVSNKLADFITEADATRRLEAYLNNPEAYVWSEEFRTRIRQSFDPIDVSPSAWERAAMARCLPDQFVVALYRKTETLNGVQDAYVNELLRTNQSLAFNPTDSIQQVNDVEMAPGTTTALAPLLDNNNYSAIRDLTTEFLTVVHTQVGTTINQDGLQVGLMGGENGTGEELDEQKGLAGNLEWMADFGRAVEVGMGLVVELTEADYHRGYERLIVTGVRVNRSTGDEAAYLGELLKGHSYADGLALVPQGTPTNNLSGEGAGYSTADQFSAEATFTTLLQDPLFASTAARDAQRDGQRLADALGLDPGLLTHTAHADGTDGQEAERFNRVLWPATFGYFAREMLEPAMLSPETSAAARRFFEDYVTGRGPVPAFRVGNVPYGVLPTTWYSQWVPPAELEEFGALSWDVMRRLNVTWTERLNKFVTYSPILAPNQTALVTPPPSRQNILTLLGLEATSAEFYQRYFVGPTLIDTWAHQAQQSTNQGNEVSLWTSSEANQPPPRPNLPGRYQRAPENPLYSNFLAYYDPERYEQGDVRNWSYAFDVAYQATYRKVVHTYADEPKPAPEKVGPMIDRAPLSEVNRIQPLFALRVGDQVNDPNLMNYVDWLATSSFDKIRLEDFREEITAHAMAPVARQAARPELVVPIYEGPVRPPKPFEAPNSLLYQLLRQAVLWRYWEAAEAALRELQGLEIPRQETELFNVLQPTAARWQWLYRQVDGQPLHEWLRTAGHPIAQDLQAYLATVQSLAGLPTARLERLLTEHLDLGNHRLDAWQTGQVLARLLAQRAMRPQETYLGAFGWLEQVRQQDKSVASEGLRTDPDNLGYIHAPSPNHGVTAAVLRQGYKSRQFTTIPNPNSAAAPASYANRSASPDATAASAGESDGQSATSATVSARVAPNATVPAPDQAANRMAVNLSSERVRRALALMEGVRTGSSLAALLGRDFEEGLFEATPATVPSYALQIERLRQHFPYADEKQPIPGQPARSASPEQDARQVVDGLALSKVDFATYGRKNECATSLGTEATRFWLKVQEQVDLLRDTIDALGDLTVSESIHQAALGNVDRAAAVLENVAKGQFPPVPDVVRPANAGVSLMHRVLVQLPQALPGSWEAVGLSALARAEPALNNWLATFWGHPATIVFPYAYQPDPTGFLSVTGEQSLTSLGWQPIDLLFRLDEEALQAGSALDLHLARVIRTTYAQTHPSADPYQEGIVTVNYNGLAPLRRYLPLLGRIRQLLANSRPANANDFSAPSRMAPAQTHSTAGGIDEAEVIERLTTVDGAFGTALGQLRTQITALEENAAAFTAADRFALRTTLAEVGAYNLPEAYAATDPASTDLLGAAKSVVSLLERRRAAYIAAQQEPDLATRYAEMAKALLGSTFRLSLRFNLEDAEAPYAAAFAANDVLLDHHLKHPTNPNPFVVEEWLQGLAPVRDALNHLEKVFLLNELLWDDSPSHPALKLTPTQLSSRTKVADERWLGVSYPNPYPSPEQEPPSDAVSLVQLLPVLTPPDPDPNAGPSSVPLEDAPAGTAASPYQPTGVQQALLLDEWVELIPRRDEDTALVFHYDQPNTEAPQTLLLAVAPDPDQYGSWDWHTVLGTISESLDLAKKRSVEPDSLSLTHLGALLPAVVAPVAREGVTLALDFRKLVGQEQFPARALRPSD